MNHRAAGRDLGLVTIILLVCATVLVFVPSSPSQMANAAGPALDGTAKGSANLASTLSVSLSTNYPDAIIVLVGINEAGGSATVQGVSSQGLTFHQRAVGTANSIYLEEWYAVSSGALSSDAIAVVLSAQARFTVMVFAISGADTGAVFDGSPYIGPGGCCGTMAGQPYGTVHYTNTFSTNNPNDFILAYDASQGNPTYTADFPLTSGDQVSVNSWMASAWGYSLVTSPQTSQRYSFTTSVGENGVTFVDAIMESGTISTSTSSSTLSSTSSATSTTTTTTTSTSTLQAGSYTNYFIMNNGASLQTVTATMLLANQLSGSSVGQYGGNWSLQLNAYSPNGFGAAFTQFVISYSGGVMVPDVESYSSTGTFLGMDYLTGGNVPSSALTTGTQVSITAMTNSTGAAVGASFQVVNGAGSVIWKETASITSYPYLEAPIVGFELILVGYGGGSQSIATFTQANGSFQFESTSPLFWTTTLPGEFSWVQFKGHSSESSNVLYGVPQQGTSNTIAQSFGTTISTSTTSTSTTSTSTTSTTTTTSTTSSTSSTTSITSTTSTTTHRHRRL